jgi:hypothetical protein
MGGVAPEHHDAQLSLLDTERDGRAWNVASLTTGASPDGLLVNFGDGEAANVRFFLPSSVARQTSLVIYTAGETARWWDKEFNLLPAQMPSDSVIKRAANQLMKQYGGRAAMEAGLKANGALEAGDMFNHELWQRVMVAVQELERTAPKPGQAIN